MIKSTTSLVGSTAEDRRREALEKVLVVEALLRAVGPAPTERDLHRLGVGDAGFIGALLGDLEPEAVGVA